MGHAKDMNTKGQAVNSPSFIRPHPSLHPVFHCASASSASAHSGVQREFPDGALASRRMLWGCDACVDSV